MPREIPPAPSARPSPLVPLELALLGLLSERPRHAYELDDVIAERRMREWADLGFSSLYQALHRMEKRGLVASIVAPSPKGRAKRVYQLTARGRAQLVDEVRASLSNPDDPVFRTELAGIFAPVLTGDQQLACVRSFGGAARRRGAEIAGRWTAAQKRWRSPWQDATFRHALFVAEAESRWADETLRSLESERAVPPAAGVALDRTKWSGA